MFDKNRIKYRVEEGPPFIPDIGVVRLSYAAGGILFFREIIVSGETLRAAVKPSEIMLSILEYGAWKLKMDVYKETFGLSPGYKERVSP